MKDLIDNVSSLKNHWDSYIGLFFLIGVFIIAYYTGALPILEKTFGEKNNALLYFIPLISVVIIFTIWAFKSHRINLYNKRKITTGLFLVCNDFDSQVRIKNIIKEMIVEIESQFPQIRLKLLPINHVTSEKSLEGYIAKNGHIIDNAFFAKIYSGNIIEDSLEVQKIEIQDISFSARFNDPIRTSFSRDVNLRNLKKNWEYVESKSFNDKKRIKSNLNDSILFFIGLYAVYIGEQEIAIEIFKYLKQTEEVATDIIVKAKNSRLNEILLRLFSFTAIKKYIDQKDLETSYNLLKQCETIFKENHSFTFSNYITLARIYYEKGSIENAYNYTSKAEKLIGDHAAIYCNRGFFGMIEHDAEKVYQNYRQLGHVYKFKQSLNYIDVIGFLEHYKGKYPESNVLFDFSIATLNFLYGDKELGEEGLTNVSVLISDDIQYSKILSLAQYFLTKGSFKSPYYHRDKKKK